MPTTPTEDRAPAPPTDSLTTSERLVWMGQRLDPGSPLYNMALAFDVRGVLDVGALVEALERVVAREPALRTVFEEVGGRGRRRVLDGWVPAVDVIDRPETEVGDDAVRALLVERTRRPLPLDRPPLDVCIVRRSAGRTLLYVNQHHVATDAWSTGLLYRRWSDAYLEVTEGAPAREPPAPPDDPSARATDPSTARRAAEARAWWEAGAEGYSSRLPLYGRPGPGSGRTVRHRVSLGAERGESLRRLAAAAPFRSLTEEQSRYLVFATVVLAWVHRVSGERRVSLGSPFHHRPTPLLRESLGLFMELFPLRVEIDDDETLSSLGRKVARAAMGTLRHAVPGASDTPGARGYGVVLNYITARTGDFAGRPASADWIHSGFGDPEHRLRLQVHDFDTAGVPTLDVDLDEETFDEAARSWALAHLFRLFDALATDPDTPLAAVGLVTADEEASFAPRGGPALDAPLIPAAFDAVTRTHPDRAAVVDGDEVGTYADLAADVGALAASLRRRGIGRGQVVAVSMDRSADLPAALLAIVHAGAAWLPIDPDHPTDRRAFVVADAGAALLLTGPGDPGDLDGRLPTVSLEALRNEGAGSAAHDGAPPAPDDLAYVLYTSGSTGRPKGVEVTHAALADYAAWAVRTYAPDGPVRMPLFTSPAFDLTLTSIVVPLLSGGTVVVVGDGPDDGRLAVRRVFEDRSLDVVKVTPSHLAVVRDLDLSGLSLRRVIVGGEELRSSVARRVAGALGGDVAVFNEYGPTEATVACMIHRYDPARDTGPAVPIGRPAPGTTIHVIDAHGGFAPRGVAGEIAIRGPRLARGYRGRPERTAQAFVPAPDGSGERMYRTGDRGRWTPDGVLEYLGRADDQVKVRGVRLELGEVEAALESHPGVGAAVARLVREEPPADEHCRRCGLQAAHPEARLDDEGICRPCRGFEGDRARIEAWFGTEDQLRERLARAREAAEGPWDTLMLYSGGKDSTYALCRIVEMGARPLVFLMDNGFISDQAKANVRKVVDHLGLDLHVATTPAMPAIFADSLARFSNVCQGCFKTIYTLALNLAAERGIPALVTGLSRGQIFETRLADLHRRGVHDPAALDATILEARKAYHRMNDAVSRHLDTAIFDTDDVLDRIEFIDFYRYVDVELDELLGYVAEHTPWIRPDDTGRSTNCLINQAGIWVHTVERGFHNYTLPYSWDVRLGHKERDAALAELDDDLDPIEVRRMLDAVGYREHATPPPESRLVAYYTGDGAVSTSDLRRFLTSRLPREAVPSAFVHLESIPLTAHGKVDRSALPTPGAQRPLLEARYVAPGSDVEVTLAEVWAQVLGLDEVGVEDDFFELGGDSMHCIQIVTEARRRGVAFEPRELFAHPTVRGLAGVARPTSEAPAPSAASASAAELAELTEEFGPS